MSDVRTLSVIVPVYFNERSLPHLFEAFDDLESRLLAKGVGLELIFVDDGSEDSSLDVLLSMRARRPGTKVIKLTRNFGAVQASRAGLAYVAGDCYTVLAADLQDPVEKVDEMVERWLQGSKFVICIRSGRDDPLVTRVFSGIFYKLVRWLSLPDYPAGGFDMMLMDAAMLPYMRERSRNTNPAMYASWLGFEPDVLSYHRPSAVHSVSRWTVAKRIQFAIDSITGFSVVPIRLMSSFGVAVAFVSFLYGAYMVVAGLLGVVEVRGFPTLVVLVSFFGGMILTMLGIIGEYLWRVFDATSGRPESIVDEAFL